MRAPLLRINRSFVTLTCKHLRFLAILGLAAIARSSIAADGDIDTTFAAGSLQGSGSDEIRAVVALPTGKILIGGHFTEIDGQLTARLIARLEADGAHETDFNLYDGGATSVSGRVEAVAVQSDGKILLGGSISVGTSEGSRRLLVRLNPDGSIDLPFNPNIGAPPGGGVDAIAVQPDGRILIGGDIVQVDTDTRNGIARLNATDGSHDTSFDPGTGAGDDDVRSIFIQPVEPEEPGDPDYKILVAGSFTEFDETARGRIARLNHDGSLDPDFETETGADHTVSTIVLQPDGKILIGGLFNSVHGASRSYLARLNTDGSLDNDFGNPRMNGFVRSIAVQPDGKIIAGGDFERVNLIDRGGIARLNADGSLDLSFDTGTGMTSGNGVFNGWVNALALQSDGKVLAGGNFNEVNGQLYDNIVRLQAASAATPPPPVVDNSVAKAALSNKIKKLAKKVKSIKSKGQVAKAKKLQAKIKKLKKKLKGL